MINLSFACEILLHLAQDKTVIQISLLSLKVQMKFTLKKTDTSWDR